MQLLKQRILTEGNVVDDEILKVDSFLNHQIDIRLYNEMGKEFKERFKNDGVTKILTVESSGIGIACITAQYFDVPVVFAKKMESKNLDRDTYESEVYSFSKGKGYKIRVSKKFIQPGDRILVIDDFLANGNAVLGLKEIIDRAGAEMVGVGIVIEKAFQNGGRLLREKGIKVSSLAVIQSMEDGKVIFED